MKWTGSQAQAMCWFQFPCGRLLSFATLTGFDAPCMHTMYVEKPMRGQNLMQVIARVNRVFKDKPGGLVVDYIGIANELKAAFAT